MDYTKLGNTDIEISKICVGCMSFGKAGIMHDQTLDEEQTAEENSPLTKNTVPFGLTFYGTNHNTFYKMLLNEGVDTEHRYRGYDDNTVL